MPQREGEGYGGPLLFSRILGEASTDPAQCEELERDGLRGVRAFEWADIPQAGGKYYSVMAMCVDDLDLGELIAAPVRYCDGKNNNW